MLRGGHGEDEVFEPKGEARLVEAEIPELAVERDVGANRGHVRLEAAGKEEKLILTHAERGHRKRERHARAPFGNRAADAAEVALALPDVDRRDPDVVDHVEASALFGDRPNVLAAG